MAFERTRICIVLLFLYALPASAIADESIIILTTKPSSVNISISGEAVFKCSFEANVAIQVFVIAWRNSTTEDRLTCNSSLGISINDCNGSSNRTSVLTIEGRQEYNETDVHCYVTVITTATAFHDKRSSDAILLIQGPLDAVSSIISFGADECCKMVSWEEPDYLSGVPILGYNVTSIDLNHESFVNVSIETVCSNQLQHDNATVIIQAYNGVDGDVASVGLDFNIDTQPAIKIGNEELTSGGQNWILAVTIEELVCSGMSEDVDVLTITLMDEENGLVIQQAVATLNGMKVVHLSLPDNRKFLLQNNFTLNFSNGLTFSSVFLFNRVISTFDFRDVVVDYEPGNKTCLRCEAIANSQAEACLLHVNSTENETDQAFTIIPNSTSIYRTCVDVVPGVYNLTAFDVSSEVGPLTATPAVILINVLVSPTTTFPPSSFLTASPSSTKAMPTSAELPVDIIVPVVVGIVVLLFLVDFLIAMMIYMKYGKKKSPKVTPVNQENKAIKQSAEDYFRTSSEQVQPNMTKVENYADIVPSADPPMHLPLELNPVVYSNVQAQPAINPRVSYEQVIKLVATKITEKWYEMGRALYLPTFVLEDIELNRDGNPTLCISDVFLEWKKQRSCAYTWEAIIDALKSSDVGEDGLAQDLEAQLQVHVPCTQGGESTVYQQLNHGKQNGVAITQATCSSDYGTLDIKGSNPELAVLEAVQKLNPSIWHRLGLSLAITPPDLEMIRVRNNDDPERCLWEVVTIWKEKRTRPFHLEMLNQILSSFGDYQIVTTTFSTKL